MKFLDIINEQRRETPLDNKFYRSALDMISKTFDLNRVSQQLKDPNRDITEDLSVLFRNMWPLKRKEYDQLVPLRTWLQDIFGDLTESDIASILYLLYRNIDVKDFKKDPLILDAPFWVTKVYYYEDEIEEGSDEETWDCERCGGSGWEYEECNACDGDGSIIYDEEEGPEDCDECGGEGEISYDCRECGGETRHWREFDTATLWRREIIVVSDEKIEIPKDGSEFLLWVEENKYRFDIIYNVTHDKEVVEIDKPNQQTQLEEERGEVDYAVQYKVDSVEDLKKFSRNNIA